MTKKERYLVCLDELNHLGFDDDHISSAIKEKEIRGIEHVRSHHVIMLAIHYKINPLYIEVGFGKPIYTHPVCQ